MKRKPGRPKQNKVNRHITIDPEVARRVDVQAERESRNFSSMVNHLLATAVGARRDK